MAPFVNKKLREMNKFSLKLAKCVVFRSFDERIFAPRDPNGKSVGKAPSPDSARPQKNFFGRQAERRARVRPNGEKMIPA